VTHTPLAAVSIFNKYLNLKNFTPPIEEACRSLYHVITDGSFPFKVRNSYFLEIYDPLKAQVLSKELFCNLEDRLRNFAVHSLSFSTYEGITSSIS